MSFRAFIEGGVASVVAGCSTHPFDVIKVRMQLLEGDQHSNQQGIHHHRQAATLVAVTAAATIGRACSGADIEGGGASNGGGAMSVVISMVQEEGVQGLFTGVSATILRQALYSTTRMGLYEVLKERWGACDGGEDGKGKVPVHKKVACGLIAGAVGAMVGNPADVAMVRMQGDGLLPLRQRRNYRGVVDALACMARSEGVGSLWKGSALTIQRAMVVTACQLATYDHTKELLLANVACFGAGNGEVWACVAASLAAGLVAALASNPIDVVKTRIMMAPLCAAAPPYYRGPLDCAVRTIRAEGALALYKGFLPTVARQAPFTLVLFLTLENIRSINLSRIIPIRGANPVQQAQP